MLGYLLVDWRALVIGVVLLSGTRLVVIETL